MTDLEFASSSLNKAGEKSQSTQTVSLAKSYTAFRCSQGVETHEAAMDLVKSFLSMIKSASLP